MQSPGSAWDHQHLICSPGAWGWVSFSVSGANTEPHPHSGAWLWCSKTLELQLAHGTHAGPFPDQNQCKLDPAQEWDRDPCVIRGFTIMGWQGAHLHVILCRLPGEQVPEEGNCGASPLSRCWVCRGATMFRWAVPPFLPRCCPPRRTSKAVLKVWLHL